MTHEENKAVIRRICNDFWHGGRAEAWDELFAPDVLDHGAAPGQSTGREGVKHAAIVFRAAMGDMRIWIEDLLAEGDRVMWRWSVEGIHQGPLMGVPATGKRAPGGKGDPAIEDAPGRIAVPEPRWSLQS